MLLNRGPNALGTSSGGGGAGGSYTAQAVHVDGATWFQNNALVVATDNGTCTTSVWFKIPGAITFGEMWISDPDAFWNTSGFSPNAGGTFDQVLSNPDDNGIGAQHIVNPDVWNHVLITADMASGFAKYYLNGIDTGLTTDDYRVSASVTPPPWTPYPFNGKLTTIFNDTFDDFLLADVADLWVAPGVSLLDATNDIPLATLRKFIDASGKPVDLGSDGSTPTGTAPAIFFSGDATAFGANRGTGGAFSLVSGALTNATTSPSD